MYLPAKPDAPLACDMSGASDTPDQRVAEYRRLIRRGLLRRERDEHSVVLAFRPAERELVEDLARREAACCPFLDYRVETAGGEVVWTISNPSPEPAAAETLDAFFALS